MLLKKGSRGQNVLKLQEALSLHTDGIFGPLTEEAVKEFQQEHGLVVDGIVGDKTWSLLCPFFTTRDINEIIVHCTATKEGKDYTVDDITRWHKDRGFSTIGYHFVIYRDGTVVPGRNLYTSGAHCLGHNSKSIGIVYVGGLDENGKPKDTRTPEQKKSLIELISKLKKQYPGVKVYPHYKYANKACPCFDAEKDYKDL